MLRNSFCSFATLSTLAVLAPSAIAQATYDDLLQTMKVAVSTDLSSFWDRYGTDRSSSLTLTTRVNAEDNTFSYTTAPGSTWMGQPASLVATGSWDAASESYLYTCQRSLGGVSSSTSGVVDFPSPLGGPLPPVRRASLTGTRPNGTTYISDRVSVFFFREPNGSITSTGQWSTYGPNGEVYEPTFDRDTYDCTTGVVTWSRWFQSTSTAYNYSGSSDAITGVGSVTATVTPAPAAAALLALGTFAICRRRR